MANQNKALVRRAIDEVWNGAKYDTIDQYVAPDFVIHSPQGDITGPEGAAGFFATLRAAFPDIHFTVEDMIADGDRVVTRWSATGTHQHEFQGIPATRKRVRIHGTDIDRIANGRVVECWTATDDLGLLQQLGALSSAA